MTRTDELTPFVASAMPVFANRLAAGPAGMLGRRGVPDDNRPGSGRGVGYRLPTR